MENKTLLKQILSISLYVLLPVVFFATLYSMAAFYYMDFDPHKWDASVRLLIALEGLVAIAAGAIIARFINSKNTDGDV